LTGDPEAPDTLFAGTRDGLYKTIDAGASWYRVETGFDLGQVSSIALSPAAPKTIWITSSEGLYVSRDAGIHWSHVGGGFPYRNTGFVVADPARGGFVYASGDGGLYGTSDDGAHWRLALMGNAPSLLALAVDPVHPRRLYAGTYYGLFRSLDGGYTWTFLAREMKTHWWICAVAVDPVTSAVYAVDTNDGVRIYRSTDGGTTWSKATRFPYTVWVNGFAFDPDHRSTLFLGSQGGVWKSTDRGKTWSTANRGLSFLDVDSLAVDPSDPRRVYASAPLSGVYTSSDRGETWSSQAAGPKAWYVDSLLVAPAPSPAIFAGTTSGVFQSTDGARTWRRLGGLRNMLRDFAREPGPHETLYAATEDGLFRSMDRGETWSLIWTPGTGLRPNVDHVAVVPAQPGSLFLTTHTGLFFSADRGETWTRRPFDLGSPYLLVVDPRRPLTLYVSSSRLFKSVDGGMTWNPADSGFPSAGISNLILDPQHPDVLYAIANGLLRTIDGGTSWTPVQGLPYQPTQLAIDSAEPQTLHIATSGHGIFDLTLSAPGQ